jgi:hypothetical protein
VACRSVRYGVFIDRRTLTAQSMLQGFAYNCRVNNCHAVELYELRTKNINIFLGEEIADAKIDINLGLIGCPRFDELGADFLLSDPTEAKAPDSVPAIVEAF